MSILGIGGVGGFFLDAAAKGQFSDGGPGLIPDAQAYKLGADSGGMLAEIAARTPLGDLPSPANLDPAVSIFGMDKGPIGLLGGFIEDTTDAQKYVGGIAGGILGGAFLGNPELGFRAGWSAGVMTGATIDASSDAGVGILDLDGKETKDAKPLVTWWKA